MCQIRILLSHMVYSNSKHTLRTFLHQRNGNTCFQAKGCAEDKVYLLCLIAAPQGIHAVCKRYPRIRVVVSEIVVVNVNGRSAPERSMTSALSKEVSAVIAGGSQVVPYGLANRKN